jgi:hypothetical protein
VFNFTFVVATLSRELHLGIAKTFLLLMSCLMPINISPIF